VTKNFFFFETEQKSYKIEQYLKYYWQFFLKKTYSTIKNISIIYKAYEDTTGYKYSFSIKNFFTLN